MISFFRKIRQKLLKANSITRYLAYALGEILLVVIGILIALQVNNWNESRKEDAAQIKLLTNFMVDLTADSVLLKDYESDLSTVTKTHKELYLARKGVISAPEIENPQLIRGSIRYHSITLSNHPNIGTQVMDDEIRNEILDYYQFLARVENSYLQYDNVVKETVRPYLAKNLTLNPDFLFDNEKEDQSPLDLDQFFKVIIQDDFGQVLFEANLKAEEMMEFFEELESRNNALRSLIKTKVR
ncbi:DUF6090 family protein [Algoriphagus sp.]|uniref:DUF6090 family protein n=1 Tax=Algoriphagus sp. TaxID=1872435 RepID=UPI0025F9ED16|nr:DUF6090 family protein [Algoriphagus sp.]